MMQIEETFGPQGPIARTLPGFEARPGQVQMAQLIERGILENAHTIVEAGTGVGKSLAYLVPALRSGKKVVISTGTIALARTTRAQRHSARRQCARHNRARRAAQRAAIIICAGRSTTR